MRGEAVRGEGRGGEGVRKGAGRRDSSYKSQGRRCVVPRGLRKWQKQRIEMRKTTTIEERSKRTSCVGDSMEQLSPPESCVECVLTRDVCEEGEGHYQLRNASLSWNDSSSSPEDILTRVLEDMM